MSGGKPPFPTVQFEGLRFTERMTAASSLRRQLRHDFFYRRSRYVNFFRLERDCSDHRMTSTAISFTDLCDVVRARFWRPGI